MKSKLRGRIPEILLICVLVVGVCMMAYPFVSDWVNDQNQTRAIATYEEAVADDSAQVKQQMWDDAVAYNGRLPRSNNRFTLTEEEKAEYDSILDVTGTGVMGYVEIPKINVRLPIYHGTDDTILQVAIGHIPGSSMPVGGKSTHCVISGHRGLPSARLFTDIDQLREGDYFTLHVLDQTLTNQVDQIRIVLPDELDQLAIEDGLDLCTLVTCTPYGVNTHRLLVRGHRVDNAALLAVEGDMTLIDPLIEAAATTAIVVAIIFAVRAVRKRKREARE